MIAWCKARIPAFPRNSRSEGASSLLRRGPERPTKRSLALVQPQQPRLAPVQPWGCPRARDIWWVSLALACKDYFLLPFSIFWEIQEFGPCTQAIGIPSDALELFKINSLSFLAPDARARLRNTNAPRSLMCVDPVVITSVLLVHLLQFNRSRGTLPKLMPRSRAQ